MKLHVGTVQIHQVTTYSPIPVYLLTVRRSDTWRTVVSKKAAAIAETSTVNQIKAVINDSLLGTSSILCARFTTVYRVYYASVTMHNTPYRDEACLFHD